MSPTDTVSCPTSTAPSRDCRPSSNSSIDSGCGGSSVGNMSLDCDTFDGEFSWIECGNDEPTLPIDDRCMDR